jgi:hypothetical protein
MTLTFSQIETRKLSATRASGHAISPFPERAVCGYLVCLPLLWLTGLTLPAAFLVVFGIFFLYVRSRRSLAYALPWFAVGASQFISVIVNWTATNEPPTILLKHMAASYVSGWLLLGSAIGIGASDLIRPQELLRAIMRTSYYSVALAVPAYSLAFLLHQNSLFILSPVGYLVPQSFASRNFFFGLFVYNWEDFLGRQVPRLSLMCPWPTAMGAAGVCMVFVALNAPNKRQRRWAIAGGILMVVASMGRLSFLALLLCLLIRWALSWRTSSQLVTVCAVATVAIGALLIIRDTDSLATAVSDKFTSARPGASDVRNAVYEQNWLGFYKSPLMGHGWPGDPVIEGDAVYGLENSIPVGSHSTVSGLLYKGGLITFAFFVFASIWTALGVALHSKGAPLRNAITLLIAVGITCFGEGLESLVLPLLFVFLWIGVSLARRGPQSNFALSLRGE